MRKLKVLKKLNKEQITVLMNGRKPGLKMVYDELKDAYDAGELDHGFKYGNFFSMYDQLTDTIVPGKVVIQWVNKKTDACEMIVDSLEELVYYLNEITGYVDVENSEVEIELEEGVFTA